MRTDVHGRAARASRDYAGCRPTSTNLKARDQALGYAEGAEVDQILGLRLNQALIGEMSPAAALNTAAKEIEAIFRKNGRKTGALDLPLPE